MQARWGGKRAMVAVMYKHPIATWYVLHDRLPYRELGAHRSGVRRHRATRLGRSGPREQLISFLMR
ncbi:hypothetical protein M2160_000112 [Streptomyces sp. SAI-117]|nr:hypothetical protein [Streptomyces sp. SAI-117]